MYCFSFNFCSSLTSIAIPSSVTSIGDYSFFGCSSLTSIAIPSSVTSIGDYAFNSCSSLTSVVIPSSVTSIGDYAFNANGFNVILFYDGSQTGWNKISAFGGNEQLNVYYYSETKPINTGNYWHYVDGVPLIW